MGLANTAGAESDLGVGKMSIPTLQERQGELGQHARGEKRIDATQQMSKWTFKYNRAIWIFHMQSA
ncbi:MAG: hypothetical protein CAK90_04940 [Spartobacteria bacterium AMD-G4]|nr:MAG: hypothetical protein CAK90_04940 [Spartobacteria bacterium AMD-G4]